MADKKINPENERKYLQGLINNPLNKGQKTWAEKEMLKYPVPKGTNVLGGGTIDQIGLGSFQPSEDVFTGGTGLGTDPSDLSSLYSPETENYMDAFQKSIDTPFNFDDVLDSTLYKSQRQEYDIAGQEAFQNTLGELSSLTGGRPSSSAVSNAAAASNRFQQQFAANVLPSLTEQSYKMHQDNISNQYKMIGIMMDKDLTEYEKKFELMEFEWKRSENNPVVKSQMLANEMNQFKVDNQDEEWDLFVRESEEAIKYAEIINEYAPKEAEARLDQAYASLQNTNSIINSRKLDDQRKDAADKKKDEEDKDPTPHQWDNYYFAEDSFTKQIESGEKTAAELLKMMNTTGRESYVTMMGEKNVQKLEEFLEDYDANKLKGTPDAPFSFDEIKKGAQSILDGIGEEIITGYKDMYAKDDKKKEFVIGQLAIKGTATFEDIKADLVKYMNSKFDFMSEPQWDAMLLDLGLTDADFMKKPNTNTGAGNFNPVDTRPR